MARPGEVTGSGAKENPMSICEEAPASAIAGRGTLLSKINVGTFLGWSVAALGTWRNRRTVANMRDFDDAQLADIGLSRGDVESALNLPANVDPTLHLIRARENPLKGVRHS
jgi:uncharacterized protein YjiS (DUF1127 family)